jgi:hypothetical protein
LIDDVGDPAQFVAEEARFTGRLSASINFAWSSE